MALICIRVCPEHSSELSCSGSRPALAAGNKEQDLVLGSERDSRNEPGSPHPSLGTALPLSAGGLHWPWLAGTPMCPLLPLSTFPSTAGPTWNGAL